MLPPKHTPPKAPRRAHNFEAEHQHKCCGVIEEAAYNAREKRAKAGPQPWIVLKMMVPVTVALIGYATYVYIARLCVRMIRRESGVPGSRGTGIALLAVYSVLLLWTLWAYLKVVITPPGFARDHVRKSQRPLLPAAPATQTHDTHPSLSTSQGHLWTAEQHDVDAESIRGPSYEEMSQHRETSSVKESHRDYRFSVGEMRNAYDVGFTHHQPVVVEEPQREAAEEARQGEPQAGVLDAIPIPGHHVQPQPQPQPQPDAMSHKTLKKQKKTYAPKTHISRRPPSSPILHPAHRYCSTDEIVKPYRTHHCRSCGTCVLKYDHHCPWIGQCVGARNQKFFLNFCQAACVYTMFIFGTILAYVIIGQRGPQGNIDPQEIVLLALSALFGLFTTTLQISHVRQIWLNQTTVESVQIRAMKDRETAALQSAFGFCSPRAKRHTRKEWDIEWGDLNTEGNIWWLGSGSRNWTDVMGRNKLGWILPIGRSLSDGLTYPVNPRFETDGRWRRRAEWPQELQQPHA